MNNFYFKEESYYASLFLPWVWSTIREINLKDFRDDLPDLFFINWEKVEKNSKEYEFINKIKNNTVKQIIESDFPPKIKEKWLNFYKLENISMKKYKEFLEMLQWKPFYWNEKNFDVDFSKINENSKNFLDDLNELHNEITDKMFFELYPEKLK